MLYVKRAQIPIRLGEYEGTTTQTKFKRNHPSKATQREKGYMGNSSNSKNTMPSVQGPGTSQQRSRSKGSVFTGMASEVCIQRIEWNLACSDILFKQLVRGKKISHGAWPSYPVHE